MHNFLILKLKNGPSHFRPRPFLTRLGLASLLIAPCALLQPGAAQAASITPNLTISGQVAFDTGFAYADGSLNQSGDFSKTVGGIITSSSFAGTTVSGLNPLAGTLTDLGDGFGMSAATSASFGSEFALGFDIGIALANNSADDYRITLKIDYSNTMDAGGPDAYVDSEFTVNDAGGEVFFSDLISDTYYGDTFNGIDNNTFGAHLSDIGVATFDIYLNAYSTTNITSAWTMEGGVYGDPGYATLDFSAFISVDEVKNLSAVPVPAALYLFGTGLSGLAAIRMRRRKQKCHKAGLSATREIVSP